MQAKVLILIYDKLFLILKPRNIEQLNVKDNWATGWNGWPERDNEEDKKECSSKITSHHNTSKRLFLSHMYMKASKVSDYQTTGSKHAVCRFWSKPTSQLLP